MNDSQKRSKTNADDFKTNNQMLAINSKRTANQTTRLKRSTTKTITFRQSTSKTQQTKIQIFQTDKLPMIEKNLNDMIIIKSSNTKSIYKFQISNSNSNEPLIR
jgi:hypothetical protein